VKLAAGAKLGPYEIVAPIAAGGMGEVYCARDTRLHRDVAVKVLPAGAAADRERRARFEQEARSVSALNHPSIVTLYDVGDQDGISYLAMELVDGRTLRSLLLAGSLPLRKILDWAAQAADGLAKAHSAGILHRDLKPENLMISKDGFIKILDFGLAKLVQPAEGPFSEAATMAQAPTTPGTVLGTVGYMSPEQASGRDVDFRSDQFSLGTILYEMLAGVQPFQRATAAETMAAVIRDEPDDLARRNPKVPAPLRWIVERCLAKDPEERFASTRDLARDLAAVRDHLSESTGVAETVVPSAFTRRRFVRGAGLVATGLAAGAAIGTVLSRRGAAPDLRLKRLTYRRGAVLSARFAPDGQSVVYGAAWDGNPPEIYSVRFDSPESRSLGLPPADVLSVSNQGELAISLGSRFSFGWESTGTLARVSLGGGAPREMLENVHCADWARDGSLAVVRDAGERRRLEFPMGKILHETAGWISHARVSPDGERVAFIDHPGRGDNVGALVVVDRKGARKTLLARLANGIAWSPRGDEVWTAAGSAVDLDGRARRFLFFQGYLHDVSRDGRVLMNRSSRRREIAGVLGGDTVERNLSWLDWGYPEDLSADGSALLFDEQNIIDRAGDYAVYLRRKRDATPVRLGDGQSLALSPDGKWALVSRQSGGETRLVLLPTGAGEPRVLPQSPISFASASWFADGKRLLVSGNEQGRGSRLYILEVAVGSHRAVSPEGVTVYRWRALSPDGRLAVALAPDATPTLYPIDGGDSRPVPGALRDDVPICWTADGRSLFVQRGSGVPARVELVDISTGQRRLWKEITPSDPAGVLSIGPIRLAADNRSYVYSYRRLVDELVMIEGVR
jgi:hypothetical protein